MSPKLCETPLLPPPHSQGNPNPNTRATPRTTQTATTMTSTATIDSPSCVSARCYLIGEMIKDASKALGSAATEQRHTDAAAPAALMDGACDFPAYTSATMTTTIAPAMMEKRTKAEQNDGESKLTITTTTPLDSVTCTVAVMYELQQKHELNKSATAAQSKPTENKCSSKELSTFSYQREVESRSTLKSSELEAGQNQPLCLSQNLTEGLTKKGKQSFAERNKHLKSEFLKNACGTLSAEESQRNLAATKTTSADSLKTSRRSQNLLKLLIPGVKTTADVTDPVLETTRISLVARRKLELNRKFEQQKEQQQSRRTIITSNSCGLRKNKPGFPSVSQLRLKFDKQSNTMMFTPKQNSADSATPETPTPTPTAGSNLLVLKSDAPEQRHSPLSDEGCNLGQSPYSSDEDNDNASIHTTTTAVERKRKDKVARSASSDSALGLDVDEHMMESDVTQQQQPPQQHQRRMTLTVTDLPLRPALLPLAEPTALPDSPTGELQTTLPNVLAQSSVPSKVLLEERVVEIHEDPRGIDSLSSSRRESAQSCFSDYPNSECGGVRFVRTPSVVVSDYSDDVMCGITLEEIEYFRAQRMRRRRSSLDTASYMEKDGGAHSDASASSSCSNLYYCGSTISALDGAECYVNGTRIPLTAERKTSACSTCSAASCGEDDELATIDGIAERPEDPTPLREELADLLAAQHLGTKRAKKVGMSDQNKDTNIGECEGGVAHTSPQRV